MHKYQKSHHNNELTIHHVGQNVHLIGWVSKRRNLGSLVFIDLRDREGITQLVFNENLSKEIKDVRNEYILAVKGNVVERKNKNDKLPTGSIEVMVEEVEIINEAKTTPLIIADETDALEETRLQYRYLDLRRPVLMNKLRTRHQITKVIRNYLEKIGCIEVETPILTKSTPEGARDYLVPSRVHPGEFYALPQSPQIFKQLLMVSGFERYYQIARCFRDEDLRADRQLDFTQVDIEFSFLSALEIQTHIEEMLAEVMKKVKNIDIPTPFERLSYDKAMDVYGSDKPDLRFDLPLLEATSLFENCEFEPFGKAIENNRVVKALVVKKQASLSRKEIDQLKEITKKHKVHTFVALKMKETLEGSILKFLTEEMIQNIQSKLQLEKDDLVLLVSDSWEVACNGLGVLRSYFGKKLKLYNDQDFKFVWVEDFPLFEYSSEDERLYAKHHPFTAVKQEDEHLLDSDPLKARANAYDIVLNGYELGGGSLRIYRQSMQNKMFELLGFTKQQIQDQFGFFIDAFQYGTPPHGGIALGLDRVAMLLTNSSSLRDVIAFPKNAAAKDPMCNAPSKVDAKQLNELHLIIDKGDEDE